MLSVRSGSGHPVLKQHNRQERQGAKKKPDRNQGVRSYIVHPHTLRHESHAPDQGRKQQDGRLPELKFLFSGHMKPHSAPVGGTIVNVKRILTLTISIIQASVRFRTEAFRFSDFIPKQILNTPCPSRPSTSPAFRTRCRCRTGAPAQTGCICWSRRRARP